MVSCAAHRNPALLAKTAATLDVVLGGRLEFGMGAGIGEAEHEAYGFDFPKPAARIEGLAEFWKSLSGCGPKSGRTLRANISASKTQFACLNPCKSHTRP